VRPLFALLLAASLFSTVLSGCLDPAGTDRDAPDPPPSLFLPALVCDPVCNSVASGVATPANEPHIAVNPRNPLNIVAGGNDYTGPVADSWTGYYYSNDGGKTWTRGLTPGCPGCTPTVPPSPLSAFGLAGDAVVAFDKDGNAYLSGLATRRAGLTSSGGSAIFVSKSTDGGATWPQVTLVHTLDGTAGFHDKEWIATGPNGEVYVAWALFLASSLPSIVFSRSVDGGRTWLPAPVIISDLAGASLANQGAIVVVGSDGTLYVTWIDHATRRIVLSKSTDRGDTWTRPTEVARITPIGQLPNAAYRTPDLHTFAIDASDGPTKDALYVAWHDKRNGDADIFLSRSLDGGATWSAPLRVNDDEVGNGKDQWMPGISVSDAGLVSLLFYDRREDSANKLLRTYYAWSDGERVLGNFALSDVAFDGDLGKGSAVGGAINPQASFMGDYQAIASGPGFAIGIWADTRTGATTNSDLYTARVQLPTR